MDTISNGNVVIEIDMKSFVKISDGLYYCEDQTILDKLSCTLTGKQKFVPYLKGGWKT